MNIDFCLEILMHYMQRTVSHVVWPNSTPVYVWEDFKKECPTIAKDMEKWLEQRENQDD